MQRLPKKSLVLIVTVILLAALGITATPAPSLAQGPLNAPGALCVRVDRQQLYTVSTTQLPSAQLIILDLSGSMTDPAGTGGSRFNLALDVLGQFIRETPDGTMVGLRTYSGYNGSCTDTRLQAPITPINRSQMQSIVNNIPYPDGSTPIAYTLQTIPGDFQGLSGPREVLLITDGQESCDGDPVAVARQLAASDPNLTIHVIGFDIDDPEAEQNLREIPRVARGTYIAAETTGDILQGLSVTIRVPFYAYNSGGVLAGQGEVNRTTLSVMPGSYQVQVPAINVQARDVLVEANRGTTVQVTSSGTIQIIQNDSACISDFCPDVPLPRLVIGQRGRVTFEDLRPQRVRAEPGLDGAIIARMELGDTFNVLDGPICADGYMWWLVQNNEVYGWTAEGVFGAYYLEPMP
ncbi:MAG: VWA domain-containing protein [Chloroflexi bacterium]|nr:VWA domain-containing protein [Chloroflexota bacterium]